MLKNLILIIPGTIWIILCQAAPPGDGSEFLYRQAQDKYEVREYKEAGKLLEDAIAATPGVSRYHHLLGKCFGRMAEQASALGALSLARKTRLHFEKAVELDGENIPALKDLMNYYKQAPGFLGGSRKKADEIEKKISRITTQLREIEHPPQRETDPDPSIM